MGGCSSGSRSAALRALIAIVLLVCDQSAHAIDRDRAQRAVKASIDTLPGDDAIFDYKARDIRIVDLDGDGVDEIVYRLTASCVSSTADCPNAVMVMSALRPRDERLGQANPAHCPVCERQQAAIRASGYADDASEQIPGDIERIAVDKGRITVTFRATLDSPACKRFAGTVAGDAATLHCPPPGRYRQTFAWTVRNLKAVGARVPL